MLYDYCDMESPDPGGHRYRFAPICPTEDEIHAIRAWCRAEFGPMGGRTDSRWYSGNVIFWFRDKEDAFVFRMRWC